jgi:hypothetical protein
MIWAMFYVYIGIIAWTLYSGITVSLRTKDSKNGNPHLVMTSVFSFVVALLTAYKLYKYSNTFGVLDSAILSLLAGQLTLGFLPSNS